MKTQILLISACLFGLVCTSLQTEPLMYLHSHSGTQAQAQNSDTRFGSPARYQRANHYRRNYEIRLSEVGIDTPQKLSVMRRSVANFVVRNQAQNDMFLVIGDDQAIAETARMIAEARPDVAADFHVTRLKAGDSAQLAWRFDTYATPTVKLVVLDALGRRAEKALTVRVGPLEDRNAALAGR